MALPPHRARLPDPTGLFKDRPREDRDFLIELVGALQRELDLRSQRDTAQYEFLLYSPNGSVYAVRVSDTGVLSTAVRSTP